MSDDFDLIDDATQMAIGDEFVIVRPYPSGRGGVEWRSWYPSQNPKCLAGEPDSVCEVTEFVHDGFHGAVRMYANEDGPNIQFFVLEPDKYQRGDRYKRFNRNKSYELDQKLDESEDLL